PDNHLAAGPDGGVTVSPIGRVGGAGCCPTVCGGIISPAGVQVREVSAPNDHLTTCPYGSVTVSRIGRVGRARWQPTICRGVVSLTCVQIIRRRRAISAPDNHLAAGPNCGVIVSTVGRAHDARACPSICGGVVLPPSINLRGVTVISAPDNHLSAGPDGG